MHMNVKQHPAAGSEPACRVYYHVQLTVLAMLACVPAWSERSKENRCYDSRPSSSLVAVILYVMFNLSHFAQTDGIPVEW